MSYVHVHYHFDCYEYLFMIRCKLDWKFISITSHYIMVYQLQQTKDIMNISDSVLNHSLAKFTFTSNG